MVRSWGVIVAAVQSSMIDRSDSKTKSLNSRSLLNCVQITKMTSLYRKHLVANTGRFQQDDGGLQGHCDLGISGLRVMMYWMNPADIPTGATFRLPPEVLVDGSLQRLNVLRVVIVAILWNQTSLAT